MIDIFAHGTMTKGNKFAYQSTLYLGRFGDPDGDRNPTSGLAVTPAAWSATSKVPSGHDVHALSTDIQSAAATAYRQLAIPAPATTHFLQL